MFSEGDAAKKTPKQPLKISNTSYFLPYIAHFQISIK